MKVEVLDCHFRKHNKNRTRTVNLSLLQRLQLFLSGHAYLGHAKKPEWRGDLPFYVVKCDRHGYYIDYPHGHQGRFDCPLCYQEAQNGKINAY